jgi:RNA polymerase sigma-70 factor (ECF subfamily)
MHADASFDELRTRLRAGDQEAAAEIFHRYAARLVSLARNHLSARIRRKVDPEDVVQSALRSFYSRHAADGLRLDDWESLWGLLAVITLRKVGAKVDLFTAARRDVRKEISAHERATQDQRPSDDAFWDAIAREPTPSEAAMLTDTLEQLMGPLNDRERQMLAMRLQGYTIPEISQAVERTERTVHRLLADVRQQMVEMQEG